MDREHVGARPRRHRAPAPGSTRRRRRRPAGRARGRPATPPRAEEPRGRRSGWRRSARRSGRSTGPRPGTKACQSSPGTAPASAPGARACSGRTPRPAASGARRRAILTVPRDSPHRRRRIAGRWHAADAGGSRWSTTSCSTCVEPSASSSRSATCSRDADLFTAVYDERGTEGRFADRTVHTSFLQRHAPDRAHVPRAAAAVSVRDGGAGPARLRPRRLELERLGARRDPRRRRHPRLLLPQPVPLRLERARGDAADARPAGRAALGVRLPALAPVGLDRRPARRHLRRRTRETTRRRVKRYFGRDARRPPPARRDRALHARPRRRRLRGALRADAAQAHRPRRRAFNELRPARCSSSATAPTRGGCGGSPGRRSASPAASATPRRPRCSARPGRSSSPRPRSSASPPSRRRPPAAR